MTHTDIKREGWIAKAPAPWQPYLILMRLDRPIGWWLLLLPGWWGILLGTGGLEGLSPATLWLMVLFFAGSVIMRGAGCVINDLWDRDLDRQVARTRQRPLASGDITARQALLSLLFLLSCGFVILIQLPLMAIFLGVLSLPLIIAYPLMKRISWWPQAFLGVVFNFGVPIGFASVTQSLGPEALLLFIAAFFWTMAYDTIYAHQDREDDALAGIKSTARLFGDHGKRWVAVFFILSLGFLGLSLLSVKAGWLALSLLLLPAGHSVFQMVRWQTNDPQSALSIFKSNRFYGLLVLIALAV